MESTESASEQVLRGTIKRITFHNPENGYSVLQISVADRLELTTIVGALLEPQVGLHILARGTFSEHPKFGRQLVAVSITPSTPSTPEGIERYLGSGLIKGIGPGTAKRIVAAFGTDTLEAINTTPEKVAKLAGVGKKKAALLAQAFAQQKNINSIMQFLVEHNISPRLAGRIYELYKERAVEVLTKDPYVLARELKGVGFVTADAIALNVGLTPESPQRMKAGIHYTLERAMDDGHCFLDEQQLYPRCRQLLEVGEEIDLAPFVEELCRDHYLTKKDEHVFLSHVERAEEFVARFVSERCSPFEDALISEGVVAQALTQAGSELGVSFSFEQEQAVLHATKYPLSIITGGPGCGKTTIIRALCQVYQFSGKRVLLAAPTGRAAQRMAQVCGITASTIHRLLKYDPLKGRFLHGPQEPLIADAIIIDEASMIDILLARSLFSAIPKKASLILVGDRDQLPSVGPGRVFGDLVAIAELRVSALSQLFRRKEESNITAIAHTINAGICPDIPEPDGTTKTDAYFIPRSDPEEAALTIEKLVADQIPRKFGFPLAEITVLTPSNRGPLGTAILNTKLQARLNPPGTIDAEQEIKFHDYLLRVGDRVCQRVNNYTIDDIGVFNGDVGTIHSIDKKTKSVWVDLWDGRLIKYSQGEVGQLTLAYATTVHRSQGSEIPCVVLALHDSQFTLLERQLIYTAVTRAKRLLIVVGSKRALAISSKRTSGSKRNSLLRARVRELLR